MTNMEALKILGLGSAATPSEIKNAYRDLAKVWHPDRFPNDPRLRSRSAEQLKSINLAYETLKGYDPGSQRHSSGQNERRDPEPGATGTSGTAPPRAARQHVDFSQSLMVRYIAAVLLLVALTDMPYGYYTFLRWVVFGTAVWMLILVAEFETRWKVAFAAIAVLFNPLFPVALGRQAWALVDLLTAIAFAVSTKPISNRLHETSSTQ